DAVGQVKEDAAFALGLVEADPTVAVAVGDGEGLQAHLQTDHLHEAAAVEVGRVASRAAVFGNRGPGPGVPVGDVVAQAAGIGVPPAPPFADPVGQDDGVGLAGAAVNAVALAEVALGEAAAPFVAEPRIDLLQVHGAAGLFRVGGVHDAHARVL